MNNLAVSLDADFLLESSIPEMYGTRAPLGQHITGKSMAETSCGIFGCNSCKKPITQGLWRCKCNQVLKEACTNDLNSL
jgi:hypothetical protein